MRVLLQRVSSAAVRVDDEVVGEIRRGLVALVGIGPADTPAIVERMARKCVELRIFEDAAGKMNRSLRDLGNEPEGAGMLVVSQFTLYADVRKGRRPSFTDAAPPNLGQELVDHFADGRAITRSGGGNWSVRCAHGRQSRQRRAGHDLDRQRGARARLTARISPATSGLFGVSA